MLFVVDAARGRYTKQALAALMETTRLNPYLLESVLTSASADGPAAGAAGSQLGLLLRRCT
jgi:hypothetical protein